MSEDKEKLSRILNLSQDIAQVKDIDVLLERILREARLFTNADAGSIYLREGDTLKFNYTQNDTFQSKLPAGKKLVYSTFSVAIDNESIAGYVGNNAEILNIDDTYKIPTDKPYSFDKSFDETSGYRTVSMLTFPLVSQMGTVTGVLQLINAKDSNGNIIPFSKKEEPSIKHFANIATIAIERAQMTRAIILRMIKMAELRDPKETGGHVNRVASYAVEVYERWADKRGIAKEVIERNKDSLRMSAMLHDVGKIAIADAILKKPARLDDDEREIMKQHTWMGAKLFQDTYSEFDDSSLLVALSHHEKWDGTGYPGHVNFVTGKPLPGYEMKDGSAQGKKGEEIPPFGRVVAIADVYDALSNKRAYKEPWDESRVIETLQADVGTHFDPDMMAAFMESLDVIRALANRYPG